MIIFTIGHSTRSLATFLLLLEREGITRLVDVRRHPVSRRYPHFSSRPLAAALSDRGITYEHAEALGGHREPRPDSPHTALRNRAFRGYADHMETPGFAAAAAGLLAGANERRTAVMCAEAAPERCHRSLLADTLLIRGVEVRHVLDDSSVAHVVHSAAVVRGGTILYGRPKGVDQRALAL